MVRALLTLGIFGQEENTAEVVEVENVEHERTQRLFTGSTIARSDLFSAGS